tara:strand:+ start:1848 stop:2090 length:243 start_codon:yes stop_codon:yes gene_type:complete
MDGSDALSDSVVSVFIFGSDSRIFLSELTDEKMVKTMLIIINKVAVKAVSLDSKFAEPLADIIPPNPPPPERPNPSLSDP